MSVLIKDMEMPKECHGCRWFYFQGTSCTEPKYYLDARCKMVESGQDWYGKDAHGGWIGESIEHIPGWTGYYPYKHCVEMGTRASQCPLCELPSAQRWIPVTERLPEANEKDENGFTKAYLVQDARWMDVARWDGKFWIAWGYGTVLRNVVAWMPLPEPWEGGEA